MSQRTSGRKRPLTIDHMKLRDLGNSYGFTVAKDALEELDLLDDDGELVDEPRVRSTTYEDGCVEYEIPLDDVVGDD